MSSSSVQTQADDVKLNKYNILLKTEVSMDNVEKELEKGGIAVVNKIPEIGFMTISTEKSKQNIKETNDYCIEEIAEDDTRTVKPNICYSYKGQVYTNNYFDFWKNQWDMQKSISNGVKFIHKSTGKATIGVIDSGVTYDNPDIYSNIISVKNFTTDTSTGIVDEQNVLDKTGHATSVVGQISSSGSYSGIAPGMKVRMYRVFDEENAQEQWILKALVQAAKDDVDVINLSFGEYLLENSMDESDRTALINIYQRAVNFAYNQGSVVVASAGNEGINLDNQTELKYHFSSLNGKHYTQIDGSVKDVPAELDHVVTVGSVDASDHISSFSNRGSKVDIYAAGGGTGELSSVGYDKWIAERLFERDWVIVPTLEGKYTYAYGTSIAAPKVSAAIGLIIEKYHLKNQPDEAIKILYDNSRLSDDENGNQFRMLNITNFVQ
ncbi:S8 family serine peptidase [Streptococcus sp. SQ9-PEA]|uniref:Leader peptide-processing serine protease n=2 Tax=Streptococcus sciuri TaxID=2973939 RepID=A0ABT2F783_9STRE|nr:S8 family serine peptidase [Streptococcus sciuri]MCS4488257.1 S8 family serine peptidase [Streptococcus sciuri]